MLDHHHKPLGVWKVPGLPAKEVEKSEHRTTELRAIHVVRSKRTTGASIARRDADEAVVRFVGVGRL
jgi:hypothetical protein